MSKLAEFRAAEKALAEQLAHLESLKNNAGLQREIEFEESLVALMKEYGKGISEVIAILDPDAGVTVDRYVKGTTKVRRARTKKIYKNPSTGEVVETKGGNSRLLTAWKSQYGKECVESWLQA